MSSPAVVVAPGQPVHGQAFPVHSTTTSQPQIMIIEAPSSTFDLNTEKQSNLMGLGKTLLIIGILCFIFQFGAFIAGTTVTSYPGIWGGVFYLITGWLGVSGAKRKLKGRLVGFLVMSIIGAIVAFCCVGNAAVGTAVDKAEYHSDGSVTAMNVILTLLSVAAFFVTIMSAVVGCGALCYRTRATTPVHYVNTTAGHTYVAQPGTVIAQPAVAGSSQQMAYQTQQWTSVGKGPLSPPSPAPQPQSPPPYTPYPEPTEQGHVSKPPETTGQPPPGAPPPPAYDLPDTYKL